MFVDVKKLTLECTGRNLEISGGLGLSMDDPIILFEKFYDFALKDEALILRLLIQLFKLDQPIIAEPVLITTKGVTLHRIDLTHSYENNELDDGIKVTTVYFDISFASQNIGKPIDQTKTNDELKELLIVENDETPKKRDMQKLILDSSSIAITHGSKDLRIEDFVHIYEISNETANDILSTLNDIGLLEPEVHEYYQKHFGDIYPEGYWELEW